MKPTKMMMKELECMKHKKLMRELQLLIFRRKGLEGSYQCIYLMGKSKEGIARLFSVVPGEMTRSNRQNRNFYLKMILKKKVCSESNQ